MTTLSRKHLLASAAVLVGSGAALGAVDSRRVDIAPRTVYRLDNTGGDHNAGCISCSACIHHAEHKYFASAGDADLERAHPYCKCRVVEGGALPYAIWVSLFGLPDAIVRTSVDARTPWVAEALASHPDAPDTPGVQPTQLHVRVLRVRAEGRLLAIDLKLSQAARIRVKMATSSGRVYARRWITAPGGISRNGLRVPTGAPAGRCMLTFELHPAAGEGEQRVFSRHVNVA